MRIAAQSLTLAGALAAHGLPAHAPGAVVHPGHRGDAGWARARGTAVEIPSRPGEAQDPTPSRSRSRNRYCRRTSASRRSPLLCSSCGSRLAVAHASTSARAGRGCPSASARSVL